MITRYNNYHCHNHESNRTTLDCVVKPIDYINRMKDLGHNVYFTTQHGWTGKYLQAYDLCKANGFKMVYSAELYIVSDRKINDNRNYHVMIIGKNKDAFYQLNEIMSESNKTGFYYKPRIDLELLLQLNPNDFFITSACVGGFLRDKESIETFFAPIFKHFGKNFYLEIQSNVHQRQINHNKIMLFLHQEYKVGLIHGNDSHYIYPEQAKDRDLFLKGKGLNYSDEDGFILDYPDIKTIIERYKKQNVFSNEDIESAIRNTLIFDDCQDLCFTKEVKMPTIYPNVDPNKKLKQILAKKWKEEKKNINPERWKEYQQAIYYETDIIIKTNMANYFLLNEKIVDVSVNKYNGILTRTGRGSAVSFYINKLLGFTEIDRLEAPIPLYPTRFMSVARILESKSLPDIDMNWASVDAPIKASKEILGEDNVYYMYALGTMQESASFRNLCRAFGFNMEEYNEVAKDLDTYRNHPKWGEIIKEAQKYIGVIDSIAPSPCSHLLMDKSISREIGLTKINGVLCACIDGYTSDVWKYLKNDLLTVRVWSNIAETWKMIGKPIPNIRELQTMLDTKTWEIYSKGLTATLNQVDTNSSTALVKRYKPNSIAELSAFVAGIRPSFASLLNTFLDREYYTTGVEAIDIILESSYHYMLYQESIMAFLVWCGMKEDYTYDIIKKISKKKFTDEEQKNLEEQLLEGFIKNTGTKEGFHDVWQVVYDASKYSFNASHALSVAWDSVYGAYLKAHYPLEYFTVVLNEYQGDTEKTGRIIDELKYFNITVKDIKFGKSKSTYSMDKESRTIYKSISSIKYLNSQIAEDLYVLSSSKNYVNFIELLKDIQDQTSVNSRQLKILTTLNFFSMFGKNKKLLEIIDLYDNLGKRKQIKISDINVLNIKLSLLEKYSGKKTEKLFKELDMLGYMSEIIHNIEDKSLAPQEQISEEIEYLGYTSYVNNDLKNDIYAVIEYKVYSDNTKPYVVLHNLRTGEELKSKVTASRRFARNPFQLFSLLTIDFRESLKRKKVGDNWIETNEREFIIDEWEVMKF